MNTTTNAHLKQPMRELVITAHKVTNNVERMRCLPDVAGRDHVVLEHAIYDMLTILSVDYDNGYWDFYRLSNAGFYMAPCDVKPYRIRCDGNYFDGEVSADTAGIIATAMAYSHLSFLPRGSRFAHAYELLCAFIFQHPEVKTIRAALD